MRTNNFAVTIDNVNTSLLTPDPTKGFTIVDGKGVFKWKLKTSADFTEYLDGIITEKWTSGFNKSIDIRRTGGVASIGGGSLQVNNTNAFYIWLDQNGVDLIGSRIRIQDLSGVTATSLYTGVISGISHNDSIITMRYDDSGKYRNSQLSRQANQESSDVFPFVIGEHDKTKFIQSVSTEQELVFSDIVTQQDVKILFQVWDHDETSAGLGLNFSLLPSINYLEDFWLSSDILALLASGNIYLKCVMGNGSDSIRRVESAVASTQYFQVLNITLSKSTSIEDGLPEWFDKDQDVNDISYLKFYHIEYENNADVWENCKGFQDNLVYNFDSNRFISVPNDGTFIQSVDNIITSPNFLAGFGKISGSLFSTFSNIVNGLDIGQDPVDDLGFPPVGPGQPIQWYYFEDSKCWVSLPSNRVGSYSGALTNLGDGSALTKYDTSVTLGPFGITVAMYMLSIYKLSGATTNGGELSLSIDMLGSDEFGFETEYKDIVFDIIGKNSFGTFKLLDSLTYTLLSHDYDASNFPKYILSDKVETTGATDDRYWERDGVFLSGTLTNLTGKNLLPITIDLNGFDYEDLEIYLAITQSGDNALPPPGINPTIINQSLSQIQLVEKLTDIDIEKGLYSKWWGREFTTTDFGSGTTDLIENSEDALNHVLRLQSFEQDGIIPPVNGWGLNYISDYTGLINNTSVYGGLQFKGYTPIKCATQISSAQGVNTKNVKKELCREMWSISSIDRDGKESMYPLEMAFNPSATRVAIDFYNVLDKKITISDRSGTDVFATPYLQYNKNYANNTYQDKITIDNTEQPAYDSSYVTGVTDSNTAEQLWLKARSLYLRYQIKNEVPEGMTKLNWVKDEASALVHMTNWLKWMGGTADGYVDRREIPLTVPYEYAFNNNFDIGSLISVNLPFLGESNIMNGIISRVNYSLNTKNPTCKLTAYVELKDIQTGDKLLLENGEYILQENGSFILL